MKEIMSYWHINATVIILIGSLLWAYLYLSGNTLQKGAGTFITGLFFILLAESSPLHFLGMHYLFSAHMVVHIILLLVCAPLLVLGLPVNIRPSVSRSLSGVSRFLNRYPWLSWMAGIGIMWFWHIPGIFDAAFPVTHSDFSIIQLLHTLSLLLAGIIFYWPLMGPLRHERLNPPTGVVYLFTACVGCSLLGLLLTFAPLGVYHHYLQSDHFGFSNLIHNQWGISVQTDQQMAGLIMWVPCCFIYLAGSVYLLRQWLLEKEEAQAI